MTLLKYDAIFSYTRLRARHTLYARINGTVCVLFKTCLTAHRVLSPPRLNGLNETQITINNCGAKMKPVHLTTE